MSGTLFVAVVALALSVASVTWQVIEFLLSGSRVAVELQVGAHGDSGVALRKADRTVDWRRLAAEGLSQPVVGVTARNRGRIAVTITGWAVAFENGLALSLTDYAPNNAQSLPFRLEPGAEVTWLCPSGSVLAAGQAWRESQGETAGRIRARVSLGTGKNVTSRLALALS